MKLITYYTLSKPEKTLARTTYPLKFSFPHPDRADFEINEIQSGLEIKMSETIDVTNLKIDLSKNIFKEGSDGEKNFQKVIDVTECKTLGLELPRAISDALTFLFDSRINMSIKVSEATLEPESKEEVENLKSFGTKIIRHRGVVTIEAGMVSKEFDTSAILHLLPKKLGLNIYSQALSSSDPLIQFRELWRVLESAFTLRDRDLCLALSRFSPVKEIPLKFEDLNKLKVIRGRASHAYSRKGAAEAEAIRIECEENLTSLKDLVSIVIDQKDPWGSPSLNHSNALVRYVRNSFSKITHKIDEEFG